MDNIELDKIDSFLDEVGERFEEPLLYPTDLKEAVIGIVEHFTFGHPLILMDRERCLDIMCNRDGMSREDAEEHFEFNVIGSFMEGVPAFATLIDDF